MCVIIHKEKDVQITIEELKYAWDKNQHGSGFCVIEEIGTGEEVELEPRIYKGMMSWENFLVTLQSVPDWENKEIIFHFRIATHGGIVPDNCHPFYGEGMVFFHNGIVHGFGEKTDKSDTEEFFETVVVPLRNEPKALDLVLKEFAGHSCKFALIYEGEVFLYGNWVNHKKLQYSNSWGFQSYYESKKKLEEYIELPDGSFVRKDGTVPLPTNQGSEEDDKSDISNFREDNRWDWSDMEGRITGSETYYDWSFCNDCQTETRKSEMLKEGKNWLCLDCVVSRDEKDLEEKEVQRQIKKASQEMKRIREGQPELNFGSEDKIIDKLEEEVPNPNSLKYN